MQEVPFNKEATFSYRLNEMKFHPKDWFNYLRIDESTYLAHLSKVTPLIRKGTIMRKAITSHEMLTATLRYLTTGRSYSDLKDSTIISTSFRKIRCFTKKSLSHQFLFFHMYTVQSKMHRFAG